MSLKVWLPLNGNLNNQGFNAVSTVSQSCTFSSGGKTGSSSCNGNFTLKSIPSFTSIFNQDEFSIGFWAKINQIPSDGDQIYTYIFKCGLVGTRTCLHVAIRNTGAMAFCFYSDDYTFLDDVTPYLNKWTHFMFTYKNKVQYVYINGTLLGSRATNGNLNISENSNLIFYNDPTQLNDFRIYNECLSDKEIKEIYKTLILHYKLNNSIVIKDYSGYKRNATAYISGGHLTDEPDSAIYDNCIRFIYDNPCIISPTIDFSGLADNFTISWWGKSGQSTMNGRMMWGFSDGNRLNLYPTNSKFCCNTGDGANNAYMNGSSTIPFSSYNTGWHHYAMTADGTNNKLYIDGEYKGTAQTYKGITGTQIILSGWDTGSNYKWNRGYLSDFRIYATTLLDSDIQQLAKSKMMVDDKQNLYTFELQEDNYTQLDYLEATGTQYIITDIKMKDIAKVTLRFLYTDVSIDQGMFGWLHSGSETLYNRTICFYGATSDSRFHTRFGLERTDLIFDTSLHTLTMFPSGMVWDNGNGGNSSSIYTISYTQTMPIFALRNDGGTDGFKNHSKAKLYYIKFYNNSGQLLGDFVPALDTNDVACLYDKVTQQFYYNQGTGNFSYGSITKDMRNKFKIQKNGVLENKEFKECDINFPEGYKRLDYIEGTGTQWIDLNTKLPYQFRIELNMTITDASRVSRGFYGTEANNTKPALYLGTELTGSTGYFFYFKYNDAIRRSSSISASNYPITHRVYESSGGTFMTTSTNGTSWGNVTGTISNVLTDSLYLFKINGSSANLAKMKVYSLKIYAPDNTTLIRNFVPAEDKNGIACLFDTVSKTTFYNQGTGSFVKGSYITPESNIYYDKIQLYNNKVISNNFYEI